MERTLTENSVASSPKTYIGQNAPLNAPLIDAETARKHIQAIITASGARQGFIELRTLIDNEAHKGEKAGTSFWIPITPTEAQIDQAIAEAVSASEREYAIYIGPNARSTQRGKKENIAFLSAIYTDLDCHKSKFTKEQTQEAVKGSPIPPDLIINSGRGLQAVWFIQPVEKREGNDLWTATQRALKARFEAYGADGAVVTDESRVLRLAGFPHRKDAQNPLATGIIYRRMGATRTLKDVAQAFGAITETGEILATTGVQKERLKLPESIEQSTGNGRNVTLFKLACYLRRTGMETEEILATLEIIGSGSIRGGGSLALWSRTLLVAITARAHSWSNTGAPAMTSSATNAKSVDAVVASSHKPQVIPPTNASRSCVLMKSARRCVA